MSVFMIVYTVLAPALAALLGYALGLREGKRAPVFREVVQRPAPEISPGPRVSVVEFGRMQHRDEGRGSGGKGYRGL